MSKKHGGKRKGAGRPPSPDSKVPKSFKLDREIVEYLDQCENKTDVIETAVKRSKAFKDWKRSKSD